MVVQGDSSEKNKGCVFCIRVCHTLIYSLTNVSRGLQCHLIPPTSDISKIGGGSFESRHKVCL